MRFVASFPWLLVLVLLAAPASAQDRNEGARLHYERGLELARSGDYEAAIPELRAAYELLPHPTALFNIAQAYIALGRPLEAVTTLERCLQEGQDQLPESRVSLIRDQLAEQRAKTGELSVDVHEPDATIELDGAVVGRSPGTARLRVLPGTHGLRVTGVSGSVVNQSVTVEAGQVVNVAIELPATPARPASAEARPAVSRAPLPAASARPPFEPVPLARDPARDRGPRQLQGAAFVSLGAGALLGAAGAVHYAYNRGRYQDWRREDAALSRERIDGDYEARQAANDELATSIDRAEPVTVGLSLAAAACTAGGLTLLVLSRSQSRPEATAPRASFGLAPRAGGGQLGLWGVW